MNAKTSTKSIVNTERFPNPLAVLVGFTLQIQTSEDPNELEDIVNKVLESSAKILDFKDFDPKNPANYTWDHADNPDLIELTIRPDLLPADAWNAIYQLRRLDKVIYAEPNFTLLSPTERCPTADLGEPPIRRHSMIQGDIRKLPIDPEWHLKQMQVQEAWELLEKIGKKPGEGVVIAHPDTGYLHHPELDGILQLNDTEPIPDPYRDENEKPISIDMVLKKYPTGSLPVTFWHGTATASLIVSPAGGPSQIKGKNKSRKRFVTGVAPGATLKPYRLGPNTLDKFEFFSPRLARAINDAARKADAENIRVISISLGGYPTLLLRRAIINAQKKGIIVVAAAGNRVPFAIWPSTYTDVVSVASSAYFQDTISSASAIGSRVDIAAPGELVMVAVPILQDGKLTYSVEPRSGTSYAAPLIAGVAALWLSYHGWDKLVERYGVPARIPLVFDKLLRKTCTKPDKWNKARWGAGIVNAYELLKTELPSPDDPYIQESLAFREIDHLPLDRGGVETFTYLFEKTLVDPAFLDAISARIQHELLSARSSPLAEKIGYDIPQWVLDQIFKDSGKDLGQYLRTFGQEIVFHLATNFTIYQKMEETLQKIADGQIGNGEIELNSLIAELKTRASHYWNKYLNTVEGFMLKKPLSATNEDKPEA